MAESVTIARPYAEAVFRLARQSNALGVWSDRLKRLALVAADDRMSQVVGNPGLSDKQVSDFFISLDGEASCTELENLIRVLSRNERLGVLAEISQIYDGLKSDAEGVREASIASAFQLEGPELEQLVAQLEAHFKTRLSPSVVVDPELIGGVRVTVGDEVLDASVRGKLDAMAIALKN